MNLLRIADSFRDAKPHRKGVMASVYDTPFWSKSFYDHKARWIHYFHQIRIAAKVIRKQGGDLNAFSMLEVGPSHGLVTEYLRKFGVKVTTLDNKAEYHPDILASVTEIPCANNSFDLVMACEILEHLPWNDFEKALREIHRVASSHVLISLPDVRRILLHFAIKLPFVKERSIMLRLPTFRTHIPPYPGAHQWEIGKRGFPVLRVVRAMEAAGFSVLSQILYHDTPRNHYFLLEKRAAAVSSPAI